MIAYMELLFGFFINGGHFFLFPCTGYPGSGNEWDNYNIYANPDGVEMPPVSHNCNLFLHLYIVWMQVQGG